MIMVLARAFSQAFFNFLVNYEFFTIHRKCIFLIVVYIDGNNKWSIYMAWHQPSEKETKSEKETNTHVKRRNELLLYLKVTR